MFLIDIIVCSVMKSIIKNKSKLSFLKTPVENLERSHKPVPNAEVLRLYREVMQMTRRFTWTNEDGEPWQDILRSSARAEFEELRTETDTLKVSRFMITWRDTVARIHEKVNKAQMEMAEHVDRTRTDREKLERNDYLNDKV